MNSRPNQARAVSSDDNTSPVSSADDNSSREGDATGVDDEAPSPESVSIPTVATKEEQQPQQRAKDPFLFFSNGENLRRARIFEEPDYSTEDALKDDGVTIRKSKISYEIDANTMMMAIMAEEYED